MSQILSSYLTFLVGWDGFSHLVVSMQETYTPFVCGEESFGTGADHVREKDCLLNICHFWKR